MFNGAESTADETLMRSLDEAFTVLLLHNKPKEAFSTVRETAGKAELTFPEFVGNYLRLCGRCFTNWRLFFMVGTKSGSQSDLSGNFPSSDKQPYLEVTAHLNINKCARSLCARLLAAFSCSD